MRPTLPLALYCGQLKDRIQQNPGRLLPEDAPPSLSPQQAPVRCREAKLNQGSQEVKSRTIEFRLAQPQTSDLETFPELCLVLNQHRPLQTAHNLRFQAFCSATSCLKQYPKHLPRASPSAGTFRRIGCKDFPRTRTSHHLDTARVKERSNLLSGSYAPQHSLRWLVYAS